MIDPSERGKTWFMYSELEREFIETIPYVALESVHENVWSEKYAGLLVRIGDMVDSFFRLMLVSKSLEKEKTVKELRGRKAKKTGWYPTINDFRTTFDPIFELSSVEVRAEYGLTNYGKLRPFENFDKKSPSWWEPYTKVKHEFFQEMEKKATLGYTLNALASLFVLNILHKESQQYLIRYTDNVFFAEYLRKQEIEKFLSKSFIGVPINVASKFVVRTPLFIHIVRIDKNTKV